MLIPPGSQDPYKNARQEAEGFVQSTLDALSAHVAILDETGTIIGVNRAWRRFAQANGFQHGQHGIGMNYLKVCDRAAQRSSSDTHTIARGIRDIIAGRAHEFEMEYPCHAPFERRWFVVRVSRFEWYGETRLIVAHQNVSELKRTQIQLTESNHRLEAILDNINNGILMLNQQGLIETANRAAARLFGYKLAEMPGMHLNQLIPHPFEDYTDFRQLSGDYGHEINGMRKDGSVFPIHLALNDLRLDDRSMYTCIIQDFTIRKRMQEERIEKERLTVSLEKERELRILKNRFLSMMSHELRTPLASIRLSYDMLKKYGHIATEEERLQALDNIHLQVEYLSEMVSDVMTLSRSETEGLSISLEEADLITYCRDVVEEFHFNYHRTHEVVFECEQPIIRAMIDRKLLRRALTNLLSNAIKYSPEGGTVKFVLQEDAETGEAIICVSDSGIGIPPEDQARLFEPFHRAANVNHLPGTGLGLPITRQVVELHGGRIGFESQPQHGTTFFIRIPLQGRGETSAP